MAIFFPADDNVLSLARKVMNDNHEDLVKARVDIGVTFAISSKEDQPALKEHGQVTFGIAKIVAPKDRVRKSIDVELWIDGDEWGTDHAHVRYAKLDHLLQRIEVKKPKPKKKKKNKAAQHGSEEENQQHEESEFLVDAGGKAILRMRKPDLFVYGGFREVIERNGSSAPECLTLDHARRIMDVAVKVYNDEEAENKREQEELRKTAAVVMPDPPADEPPVENRTEQEAMDGLLQDLSSEA